MPLSKLNIRGNSAAANPQGQLIFHVQDTHALIQAAGYLKHVRGSKNAELVYFRGESKLYRTLSPTALRGISSHRSVSKAIGRIHNAITQFSRPLKSTGSYAHEALLQHYGLKTTWIDLVDNIWVALWFACHNARSVGPCGEYTNFERRSPRKDPTGKAYVLLVAADAVATDEKHPGLYIGPRTELIDLRIAAPSIFVRPHAQHGLLIRRKGDTVQRPTDYGDQIRGILEIDLTDALEWLGNSTALSPHSLFPPPSYDNGYGDLLAVGFQGTKNAGCISHIGA
ncbi:FRG domain-containing protein [Luteibacter sahnii]|uniref:FRG domain-containing protein n=1 Tax=Luteibacter sahnii TaxID=3021977 RepID=UPI002A6A2BB0|nr:FRG domain-containing protein [Luteibacter sp. PPL193]MDY1549853.1 FRG domain-containing protein [Luteibacter sp. PPL193]